MFRLRVLTGACGFLALATLFVRAQDTPDAKAILRKAIEAHGGEKVLNKFRGSISKLKGTMEILNLTANITGTSSFQKPDKMKNVMTIEIMDKTIELTQVFDGKKFWISTMGKTQEITDEKLLKEVRESLQVEGADSLVAILEKPYELNVIGDAKVKGKEAIGVRVSKKGQRDFSLYFDKKTHLVVKTEMRAYDAMSGQEITQEKYIVGYQEKAGMKVAKRVEIQKDGKAFMDIEIIDVQVVEKLDDATFAKP